MDGTPMVVTIISGHMKCILQATLWDPPCNPPWLLPCACIVSFSIFSSRNLRVLVYFCFDIVYATYP